MELSFIQAAAEFVRARTSIVPKIGLVLGSGLGGIADRIEGEIIGYDAIPGFAQSSAPGHAGALHVGLLNSVPIVAMNGRLHMYEGFEPSEVVFPIQVMSALGAQMLVLTNAAGGLNPNYSVGDLVLIEDHLSLANLAGSDPMRGPNDEQLGPRFVTLNGAYSKQLMEAADKAAKAVGQTFLRGVYGFAVGPSLETPAEVRALRQLGCELVGMSTVPEVIAARHCGMEVLAISAVANMAISNIDDENKTTAEDVYAAMEAISPKMNVLLEELVPFLS